MALIEINTTPTTRELRQFAAFAVPLFAAIVCVVLRWRYQRTDVALVIMGLTLIVSAVGVYLPAFVRPVYLGWMYAAYPIGWVIGHLAIGMVFFCVLTPIGLLLRFLGRDPLGRNFEESRSSYWESRDATEDSSHYFRQF